MRATFAAPDLGGDALAIELARPPPAWELKQVEDLLPAALAAEHEERCCP